MEIEIQYFRAGVCFMASVIALGIGMFLQSKKNDGYITAYICAIILFIAFIVLI